MKTVIFADMPFLINGYFLLVGGASALFVKESKHDFQGHTETAIEL